MTPNTTSNWTLNVPDRREWKIPAAALERGPGQIVPSVPIDPPPCSSSS